MPSYTESYSFPNTFFYKKFSKNATYAHSNFRSDIIAQRNEFISHSAIFNNN